jgi:O-methyltransferase involved in polyketide biosynthesis
MGRANLGEGYEPVHADHRRGSMNMSEITVQSLDNVAETLLIPLYIRAIESQRPDALLKDEKAVALVRQMDYDFSPIMQAGIDEHVQVALALRNREFDRYARDFMARHPEAVVVHIGCGLDARFERVCSEQPDNGQVE